MLVLDFEFYCMSNLPDLTTRYLKYLKFIMYRLTRRSFKYVSNADRRQFQRENGAQRFEIRKRPLHQLLRRKTRKISFCPARSGNCLRERLYSSTPDFHFNHHSLRCRYVFWIFPELEISAKTAAADLSAIVELPRVFPRSVTHNFKSRTNATARRPRGNANATK